ncbi:MAG: hypothetical protein AAF992_22190 [Bacteroidota bacterium]
MKLQQTLLELRADLDARKESYPTALPVPVLVQFRRLYIAFNVIILSFVDTHTERLLTKYSPHSVRGSIFNILHSKKLIERDVITLMIEFCDDMKRVEERIGKQLPGFLDQLEDKDKE